MTHISYEEDESVIIVSPASAQAQKGNTFYIDVEGEQTPLRVVVDSEANTGWGYVVHQGKFIGVFQLNSEEEFDA